MLLSSHILAEVEALCDRVSIIRHGRTVQSRHARANCATSPAPSIVGRDRAPGHRPGSRCPACTTLRSEDGRVRFDVDSDHLGRRPAHLTELGVRSLSSAPPTLEELFLRHYGDELAEDGVAAGRTPGRP